MKTVTLAMLLTVAALTACDTGNKTPKTSEGGTTSPTVTMKPGEKATAVPSSSSAAQAERGSGTTATTSAGTTTSNQTTSTGGTTR